MPICIPCSDRRVNVFGLECPFCRKGLSHREIARRLVELAEEMDSLATAMDYYGGFAEWAKHGREIAGAGNLARQWAEEILSTERG